MAVVVKNLHNNFAALSNQLLTSQDVTQDDANMKVTKYPSSPPRYRNGLIFSSCTSMNWEKFSPSTNHKKHFVVMFVVLSAFCLSSARLFVYKFFL